MTLSHLLLFTVLHTAITLAVGVGLLQSGIAPLSRTTFALAAVPAFVAALAMAGPVARLLRLAPFMVLAGPCPRCASRPSGWWCEDPRSDPLRLACGNCNQMVEVWVTRAPSTAEISLVHPTYVTRWPTFLGIWRRLGTANAHDDLERRPLP